MTACHLEDWQLRAPAPGRPKPKPNLRVLQPPSPKYGFTSCRCLHSLNSLSQWRGHRLSLYIHVLPGTFDNLLEWPSMACDAPLLDQSDPGLADHSMSLRPFTLTQTGKNFQNQHLAGAPWMRVLLGLRDYPSSSPGDIHERRYVWTKSRSYPCLC